MLGHYLLRRGDAWTRLAAWTVVYIIMSAAYRHDQGHGACACLHANGLLSVCAACITMLVA